jgi:adenosylhomocysteine nucleosidase
MTHYAARLNGFAVMATSIEFGMVAALQREVRPLLRRSERVRSTSDFVFYEIGSAVIVCGGIGKAAAQRAASAIISAYRPQAVISVGFAGALRAQLKTGNVFIASEVLDVATGRRFRTETGEGLLVTVDKIAAHEQKRELVKSTAWAVDMEAAAVAEIAQQHGTKFFAVKAISDESDFPMPAIDEFVNSAGKFRIAAFLMHVAVRPRMWRQVRQLARNSALAANVLSEALDTLLTAGLVATTHRGDIVRQGSV